MLYFIVGCCFGSFIHLSAERIPLKKSVLFPSSHCIHCGHSLKWFELLPIISLFILKGRCRYCRHVISWTYPFTELVTGLLFFIFLSPSITVHQCYYLLLMIMALSLSLTDLFYLIVEPQIFYFFALLIIGIHLFLAFPFYWESALFIGFLLILSQKIIKHSLGGGDILLIVFWSFLLEINQIMLLLFLASFWGFLFLLCCRVLNRPLRELPFVPFLSLALFFTLL